jgi:cell division protein FtsX
MKDLRDEGRKKKNMKEQLNLVTSIAAFAARAGLAVVVLAVIAAVVLVGVCVRLARGNFRFSYGANEDGD